jgi:hypothetical protein
MSARLAFMNGLSGVGIVLMSPIYEDTKLSVIALARGNMVFSAMLRPITMGMMKMYHGSIEVRNRRTAR